MLLVRAGAITALKWLQPCPHMLRERELIPKTKQAQTAEGSELTGVSGLAAHCRRRQERS